MVAMVKVIPERAITATIKAAATNKASNGKMTLVSRLKERYSTATMMMATMGAKTTKSAIRLRLISCLITGKPTIEMEVSSDCPLAITARTLSSKRS